MTNALTRLFLGLIMATATIQLTPEALDWEAKLDYMAQIPVQDLAGGIVDFVPTWAQERILSVMERQMAEVGHVKLLVLKRRRVGVSELITRLFDEETTRFRGRYAGVASDDSAGTKFLWEKLGRIIARKPNHLKRKTRSHKDFTLNSISYAFPHESVYRMFTAGTTTAGRGGEHHLFHWSEVAHSPNGKQFWTSMSETVPGGPGTITVWETTANGHDDVFYPAWEQAVQRMRREPGNFNGWVPLFLGFLDGGDCVMSIPQGYDMGELDPEERSLAERGATPEHLYFRRFKIATSYIGDPKMFKQEYPSYAEEAFLYSSRRVIEEDACERLDRMCRPARTYTLAWDPETTTGMRAEVFPRGTGAELWEVWKPPDREHDYVVFGDVALGILCDPDDERSDPDWSVGVVLDRVTLDIVAGLRTRMDLGDFGEELIKAAIWYNNAPVTPEMWPGPGIASLERMRTKRYPYRQEYEPGKFREGWRTYGNIYRREKPADRVQVAPMEVLGWRTDKATRPIMIRDVKGMVHRDPLRGWEDCLKLYWAEAVCELRTFEIAKSGKAEAKTGTHDDIVMAIAGAIQLHRRCARQLPPTPKEGDQPDWMVDGKHIGAFQKGMFFPSYKRKERSMQTT